MKTGGHCFLIAFYMYTMDMLQILKPCNAWMGPITGPFYDLFFLENEENPLNVLKLQFFVPKSLAVEIQNPECMVRAACLEISWLTLSVSNANILKLILR